ncbi:hypothetical protein LY76DRAFT_597797 [Colletotrichum caudatum]|nr:hypothetical protein LY76DRAFT_597797 [Colletotrichum caudatum]
MTTLSPGSAPCIWRWRQLSQCWTRNHQLELDLSEDSFNPFCQAFLRTFMRSLQSTDKTILALFADIASLLWVYQSDNAKTAEENYQTEQSLWRRLNSQSQ